MEYIIEKNGFSATVKSLGAELVSFRAGDREYIWQGDPTSWAGQNPNLFPCIGAVDPKGYAYGGEPFPTPRHGFARDSEFELVEQRDGSVTLELRHSDKTLALYPYTFIFRVCHILTDSGFRTEYYVENPGTESMSFCLGGHTGFNIPGGDAPDFGGWSLRFEKEENAPAILPLEGGRIDPNFSEPCLDGRELPLRHEVFDRVDTLIFRELKSGYAELAAPDGQGIKFTFGEFPLLAVWSPPGKNAPFICLEPWQGWGAAPGEMEEFAEKPWALTLQPGESRCIGYEMSII